MSVVLESVKLESRPIVCVRCSESVGNHPVLTTTETNLFTELTSGIESVSTIIFDASMRPKLHVPLKAQCAHEYVTYEEHKARIERLAEAKRQARAAHGMKADRKSVRFTLRAKDRMELAFYSVDFRKWSMRNPPRMLVLKIIGTGRLKGPQGSSGERYWFETCPSFKKIVEWRNEFAQRWFHAFGEPLDALSVNEFQLVGGNPHIHLLLCLPVEADGVTPRRTKHKKLSKYAKEFDNLEVYEFVDKCWGSITKQPYDLSNPRRKGRVSWLAEGDAEVKPLDSIMSHVSRFVDYCRKDGEDLKGKADQHLVPSPFIGQQVNFWAIIGFKGDRRAAGAPIVFECRTVAARNAVRDLFHKWSGRDRVFKTVSKRDADGNVIGSVEVEVSYWSNDRNREQGGRFHRRLTPSEMTKLRRTVAFYNSVGDTGAPMDEENLLGLALWDAEAPVPFQPMSASALLALLDAPPAWWELPGSEEYLAVLAAESISEDF